VGPGPAVKRVPNHDVPVIDFVRAAVGVAPVTAHGGIPGQDRTLAPVSLELVQQTLAKGLVLALARRGGWRRGRFLVDGEVVEGRLWERHPQLELRFTKYSMELIFDVLQGPRPGAAAGPRTVADEVFAYLVADLLRKLRRPPPPSLARAALPWLAAPGWLVAAGRRPPGGSVVRALVTRGAPALEALQDDLTHQLVQEERSKPRARLEVLLEAGPAQAGILEAYLDAIEDRPDLARFLLAGAARLAAGAPGPEAWFDPDPRASLSRRAEASAAAAAFLRTLERLEAWRRRYAAVRFFEDEHEVAQLFLEDWARLGSEGYARLRAVRERLEAYAPAPVEDRP